MSGSTPLAATHRLEFQLNVAALEHRIHVLCDLTTGGTGPSGLALIPAVSGSAVNFEDGADQFWTRLQGLYHVSETSFGNVIAAVYAAGAYNPIASWATAVVPNGTPTHEQCVEETWFFRNASYQAMKIVLPETSSNAPQRQTGSGTMSSEQLYFYDGFFATSLGTDPKYWARSRNAAPAKFFVSDTIGLSRRTRRRRGLL